MSEDAEKSTILVVDDTPENIDVLSGLLSPYYRVRAALNGERALAIASGDKKPDLILLDIMMPGIDGYEVCRRLKGDVAVRNIPVIFVTAKIDEADETMGFELGAADYLSKPIRPSVVLARVRTHLALYNQNRTLEDKVRERTAQLNNSRLELIHRLGRAAEYKDNETGLHVIRMSHYARLIAQSMGMDEHSVELLFHASPMHDIGKIGIPDQVLQKPGKLDEGEWKVMRRHPGIGAGIIGYHDAPLLEMARVVALTHHEKWNGQGYPEGLSGNAIPVAGRVVAVADVFDALTSRRPYKDSWMDEKAVDYIHGEAGIQFDPAVVAAFDTALPKIIEIKARYKEP